MSAIPPPNGLHQIGERSIPLEMTLPGSLYDHTRRVVAAAGTTIGAKQQLAIARLATSGVFADAAWPYSSEAAAPATNAAETVDVAPTETGRVGEADLRRSTSHGAAFI